MLPPSTAYSPTPIRATTPIYEVKETRLQLFLYPPSHPTSLRLSFFLTRLPALPPSGSSVLPSSPQNLPRTQPLSSPFRLSRDPDERQVYGINAKQSGIHLHFGKKYMYTYAYRSTRVLHGDRRNRLSPKISSFRVDDTFRGRFAGEILMSLILRPGQESAPRIEEVLILSIKIY